MISFLWGAIAATSTIASLFFFRFWKETRDRFFLAFGAAFLVFAANYIGLAVLQTTEETRHLVYLVRLVAFGLIIAGIIDKNLQRRG